MQLLPAGIVMYIIIDKSIQFASFTLGISSMVENMMSGSY